MSKFIFLILVVLACICTFTYFQFVLSISPAFVRQEVSDNENDWTLSPENCTLRHRPDIRGVSYSSNSTSLVGTFWLTPNNSKLFDEVPYNSSSLRYMIYIDADNNKRTGQTGYDYGFGIRWYNKSQVWKNELIEFSKQREQKLISSVNISNISRGFTDEQKRTVELSTDLKRINFPQRFDIAFQIEERLGEDCLRVDSTSWLPIPPPELALSTLPTSITLRPNEEELVTLFINTSTNLRAFQDVNLDLTSEYVQSHEGVSLRIYPNETKIPSHGLMTAELHIKVSPNANYTKTHLIPIHANLTFPSLQRGNNSGLDVAKTTYVSTTILRPLEYYEHIERGLESWGSPITTFLTIIITFGAAAAVIIPGIKFLKGSRKK